MTRTTGLGLTAVGLMGLAVAVWSVYGLVHVRRSGDAQLVYEAGEAQEPLVPRIEAPEVSLSPPLPPGPVILQPSVPPPGAKLMQPVPVEPPPPEPPARVTAARLPLVAPLQETEPNVRGTWTRPEPLEEVDATAPALMSAPPPRVRVPQPLPALVDAPLAVPKVRPRPILFTGTHPCSVGEARELTLPTTVRRQMTSTRTLFAAPGPEGAVLLYTTEGLSRLTEQLDRSPAAETKVRRARRVSFAQAERCSVDRDGRLYLPDPVARHGGVRGDCYLIGVGDHWELWEAARWEAYLQGNDDHNRPD